MGDIDSVYAVATVLGSVAEGRWDEVRQALEAGGTGHPFAPNLDFGHAVPADTAKSVFEEACQIAWQDKVLRRTSVGLHINIDRALARVTKALHDIKTLEQLGDGEYMDGGTDVEHYLNEAARALRTAQQVKPTDEAGDMR